MADFEKETKKRKERWQAKYGMRERRTISGGLESHVSPELCEAFWERMQDAELDELGKGIGRYSADYLCAYVSLHSGTQTKDTMKAIMALSNDEIHHLSNALERVGTEKAAAMLEMLTEDKLQGGTLGMPEFSYEGKVKLLKQIMDAGQVSELTAMMMELAPEMPAEATADLMELVKNEKNEETLIALAKELKALGITDLLANIRERAGGNHDTAVHYGNEFLRGYRKAEMAGVEDKYMEIYKNSSRKYPSLVARRMDDLMKAADVRDVKPVLEFVGVLNEMESYKAEAAASLFTSKDVMEETEGRGVSKETLALLGKIEREYDGGMAAFLNDYAEAVRNGEGKDFVRKFEEEKPAGGGVGSGSGAGSDGCHVWVPKPSTGSNPGSHVREHVWEGGNYER